MDSSNSARFSRRCFAIPYVFFLFIVLLTGCQRSQSSADSAIRIELDANKRPLIRVGLPGGGGGQDSGRSRNGAWAPVYVNLKVGGNAVPADAFRLAVESTDSEDNPYRFVTSIPPLAADEDYFAITYVRPGSGGSDVKVALESTDGRIIESASIVRDSGREILAPRDQLFLAIGSRLPGLRRALLQESQQGEGQTPNEDVDPEDRGSRRAAFLDNVAAMPDRWFGYDAADVAILTTGSDAFLQQLLEAPEAPQRRKALAEWVRRGGKLVVSVGHNHQLAAKLFEQMPLLNCGIGAGAIRRRMQDLVSWASPAQLQRQPLEKLELAGLIPGPDVHVIVAERKEPNGDAAERPLLVQSSFGLGRVVVVAFDLETAPFTAWAGQPAFWSRLLSEFAQRPDRTVGGVERQELGAELRRRLEDFPGVTPVSFGWVALLILVYIVIIGPLDYLILKKIFKRLDFTWITFPIVVVAVSAAAYFTAYAFKGDQFRINKVDLVEIDLNKPQIYGQSWFTLFSPRIQNYTVGIEPAWPNASTLLTVHDDPIRAGRSGSQGIFSRPYEYAADGNGVQRVPVPIWATRTFAANWRAAPAAGTTPIAAALKPSRSTKEDAVRLSGTIANHLDVDLHEVALFYRNRWYAVGVLPAGRTYRIDNLEMGGSKGHDLDRWFAGTASTPSRGPARNASPALSVSTYSLIKTLLFHRHDRQASGMLNSNLRPLDQQWRLVPQPGSADTYRDEVLLVGRSTPRNGPAEELTREPGMPTKLWLGELPADGRNRPPLAGLLTQETYVRVYIPVRRDK